MYKIAVMGDYESICGFTVLGLDVFPADSPLEARTILRRIAGERYGILYITEGLAALLAQEIGKLEERSDMAVIQIPGISHNTGAGILGVSKNVETAVGADILFGRAGD